MYKHVQDDCDDYDDDNSNSMTTVTITIIANETTTLCINQYDQHSYRQFNIAGLYTTWFQNKDVSISTS